MKRSIKVLIIFAFLILGFKINVNAENINDLKTRDIVIGTTRFKAGTWISSTRASKAGALYTNITGSVNVKSYMYITPNIIYEINDDGAYRLLSSEEIGNLEIELNIYYENNIPLNHEYTRTNSNINGVDSILFDYAHADVFTLNDSKVQINYEKGTVTCPFGYEFEYSANYCEDEECRSGDSYNYNVICGFDYDLEIIEEDNVTPIQIKKMVPSNNAEYLNQDKVEVAASDYQSIIDLLVNDKLDKFNLEGEEDTYYALDLVFDANNDISNYSIYSSKDYYAYYNIGTNTITIILKIDMYNEFEMFHFAILDPNFSTYEEVHIVAEGFEKEDTNFEITNITKVSSGININSNYINEITIKEDEYIEDNVDINFTNPLEIITHNEVEGRWITLDFEFNESYNLEHLDVDYNPDNQVDYEILGDKLRVWINMDMIEWSNLWLHLYYNLTNGKPYENINMNFEIESDFITYMWDSEKDSAGKSYLYIVNGIGTKIPGRVNVTYKDTNYSEDIIISDYGTLLFKDLITINSVSDLKEGE